MKIDIIEEMSNDYVNGTGLKEISKKYNIAASTVRKRLIKNNVKMRIKGGSHPTHKINYSYFERIDTPNKAYFLGLLCADGCINYNKERHYYNVSLSLVEQDEYLVKSFGLDIFINGPLSHYYTSKLSNNRMSRIHVCSKKICDDLIKLGCKPRKSLTMKFSDFSHIPKELFNHFIRGYFDGDGCAYLRSGAKRKDGTAKKYLRVNIIGSVDFIQNLSIYLNNELNINATFSIQKKNGYLNIDNLKDTKIIYNYMYFNATIFLPRKKKQFDDYLASKQ